MSKMESKDKSEGLSRTRRLNNYVCPEGMAVEDWQRALRTQQAQREKLWVDVLGDGEFQVTNAMSKNKYKVVYRGEHSNWDYCSCMDFKTSQLGTCKHLEAVKLNGYMPSQGLPPYTSVYLDYSAGRTVRIRYGVDNEAAFRSLAADYFDGDECLRENAYPLFGHFLMAAAKLDNTFRCYPDVLEYVAECRDRMSRGCIMARYTDSALDQLLTVRLFPYQKEGVRFAVRAGKAIIADEMGLGKTIQAIATAELMRKEGMATNILVMVPTSLKYQWKHEIERFAKDAVVEMIEGLQTKRVELYNSEASYKIVSYNTMVNDVKLLGQLSCDLLIMDEVQRLKNWNTQIAKAARKIVSQYAVILSGTPLENKLEELYSIVELADQYVLAPYYKFRQDCIMTDASGKVLGYKNLNKVGERLSQVLIRRRKVDVSLQLPERMDKNIFVPMTQEQRLQHDEFRSTVARIIQKWQRYHFLSDTDRKRLMLLLSQMRMVCDSTFILDQKTRNDTKIDEAMNMISNIVESGGGKVVVFSQWERMTRLMAQELDKQGIGYEYLHGGVPSSKRKDLIANFTDCPQKRVFLSTDAGSTGLNLQAASTIINLDLPWNPAVLEQRIARIYRIGQKNNIQVINLVSANTIEEGMIAKLRFKSTMFEGVLDGGEDTVFANDDKFKKIIDMVGEYIESEPVKHEPQVEQEEKATQEEPKLDTKEQIEPNQEGLNPDIVASVEPHNDVLSQSVEASDPHQLIQQGMSFLTGLAQTLQSPESTQRLVDSLVEEDDETGQATIKIPVQSKQTLQAILQLIGSAMKSV